MLARVAESLYWIGRYVERAENTARLLDVNYYATLESAGVVEDFWEPLIAISGSMASYQERYGSAGMDGQGVPIWLAFDRANPSSIVSCLSRARENARSLRDRIPSEMWEAINRAYLSLCFDTERVLRTDALHDYCVAVREACQLFFGMAFAALPRDQGWAFLRLGQKLERADNVLRLLQVRTRPSEEDAQEGAQALENHRLMAVLKTASAYEAHRKRYRSRLEPRRVAEFLLLAPDFPRSVRYSAMSLAKSLRDIAAVTEGPEAMRPAVRSLLRDADWLVARLAHVDVRHVIDDASPGLGDLLADVTAIGTAIHRAYFTA
ncbi:alpha-E domain-containing protein [Deinococcus yavapaiensis]|uniref:Putative alpha-E superfamily protein n=1 Tax=Deinococcus yavapaiensis KR-236 TaxID=694435 RepID=A0A318SB85_9DEIO|nr:alpha-E domain-containing protein [Deinococcus yavapaiensis]PYE53889.1 putative alpha-E superfamily protein [Deinococcus yavapaiensis KR-236]